MRYAPLVELLEVEPPRRGDLRQQRGRPHDRAGDQVREERDERRELHEVARRRDLAAIDVDDVAHRLERVERDADRQRDLQVPQRDRQPRPGQGLVQALGEEVVVLEVPEQAQVQGHAQRDDGLAPPRILLPRDPEPAGVVHDGGEDQQREEPGVPHRVRVEIIGRAQEQDVLRPWPAGQQPVGGEQRGEEQGERVGIEEHATSPSVDRRPGRREPMRGAARSHRGPRHGNHGEAAIPVNGNSDGQQAQGLVGRRVVLEASDAPHGSDRPARGPGPGRPARGTSRRAARR